MCVVVLAARAVTAQAEEIPRGVAVPRVECKGEPKQSYARYLPSSYDPAKKWPALYIFEPLARAQALNQEKGKALKTLVKAGDLGFANAEQIEKEPALDSLRDDPSYAEILAKIRARSSP